MKRLILLFVVTGLTGGLLVGCFKREKRAETKAKEETKARKEREKAAVAVKSPIKTPRLAREVIPGSVEYLDSKNGFRDVVFGQRESSITNLVLRSQDDQRQLKTFARVGDELSLASVPLESIEYVFFKEQLYQVITKWRIEQKNPARKVAPAVTLAQFCTSLYGRPNHPRISKDGTDLGWQGRRVALTLTETVTPGVRDAVKGGWAIPPAAAGLMIFENIDLRKALGVMLAKAAECRKDGL